MAVLTLLESFILGAGLALTLIGFPSWPRLALARLMGKQYVLKLTKDNVLTIEGATETEGAYRTKNGVYEMEPEDCFSFNGSTGAIWYAPYNRSVNARIMPLLRKMREQGIINYAELKYYTETPLETIAETLGEAPATFAAWLRDQDGQILKALEVVRITDLKNFLESRSPAVENGIIERDVNIIRRKMGNPLTNTNFVMMLVMAGLLGLCFGYILAGGGAPEAPAALQTAAAATGQMTQLT